MMPEDPSGGGPSPLAVITGPTASGKGSVARELALLAGAEIISMDSMKVYREMDVATAKPSAERRAAVPHHLIDFADPSVDFSVGDWLPLVESALCDIAARGRRAILSGGTPLYLKAYLQGFRGGSAADWDLRSLLLEEARERGPEALHERLAALDPAAARKIHPRDLRRIVRALEVFQITGRAISEGWRWGDDSGGTRAARVYGLEWDRAALYRRIDRRVEVMVSNGLFEEAERLRARMPALSRSASQAIGYKEIWDGLRSGRPHEEIVADIQRATRRLAKHQLTWFRRLPIRWIPLDEETEPRRVARSILEEIGSSGGAAWEDHHSA